MANDAEEVRNLYMSDPPTMRLTSINPQLLSPHPRDGRTGGPRIYFKALLGYSVASEVLFALIGIPLSEGGIWC